MPEKFSSDIRKLLQGDPFGELYPPKNNPKPITTDGRTAALTVLKQYLSDLSFLRLGAFDVNSQTRGPPIEFTIPKDSIYIEWPDDEVELKLPAIALLAQGPANFEANGLTTNVEESTQDQFGEGTVIIGIGEYVENFVLEIWSETKAHRRSLISGIEQALYPVQQSAALRFSMPDYYDQLCCFVLQSREIVDDEEAVRVRRRARMVIELRYNMVNLVNSNEFMPSVFSTVNGVDDSGNIVEDSDNDPGPSECTDDTDC